MKITLFLSDFRKFVKNKKFSPEGDEHPVFYFETMEVIRFYKPIGNVLYRTELTKQGLPKNITIDELKQEFQPIIEIPEQPDPPKQFTVTAI